MYLAEKFMDYEDKWQKLWQVISVFTGQIDQPALARFITEHVANPSL